MSCRIPRKSLIHFCTETSLETIFSKSPEIFPLTNPIGLSRVFNPLDLYASVSTVEILSSHGFPGCSLCSSTTSLSHLLTTLFVCLHPLGRQQLLSFKTWLSAFLPQYSPSWSTCHIHYWTLHGSFKINEPILTFQAVILSITNWSCQSVTHDIWMVMAQTLNSLFFWLSRLS